MINDEIDWNQLLNFDDGVENLDFFATATSTEIPPEFPAAAAAKGESWMGELEELLMKDDDDANTNFGSETTSNSDFIKEFDLEVCDLLLASSPSIGNENDVLNDKGMEINHNFVPNCENYDKSSEDDAVEVNDNDNDDDPLTKKRKRISAVGFPGLVNGQHMPASSVQAAPVKSGCSITGKRGQKKSGNRKTKRKGNQDK
ncbi:hypothetical protein KSS87_020537 [Heliosperma pusillum]|nr:hypothetical protein KSS87_020537 [Heliosperma pusillum]